MAEFLEDGIYTLTDEEGKEEQFELIGACELEGVQYYALAPVDETVEEYVILRGEVDENGEVMLVTIEDDEEFDRAADYFDDELFSDIDYDAMADEGDAE